MSYQIRVTASPQLIHVVVDGVLDLDHTRRILADLTGASEAHPGSPILVDTRQTDEAMTATDVYEITTALAESGISQRVRLAVLDRVGREFDRASYLEQLGRNRGLQVRHFHEHQEALDWLSGR